jgi:hypothetical protein
MSSLEMRVSWAIPLLMLVLTLAGCGTTTPFFLVESRLVESQRRVGAPDVTETSKYRAIRDRVKMLGLKPPDVCADRGQTGSAGSGQLQQGILRTRCGVEMAEFERALSRAGYEVVSWSAVQHLSRSSEISLLESANELGIQVLIQVNALERIQIQPGRDARFERRFYRATRGGQKADAALVEQTRKREFESLIQRKEASLARGKRVGATINASAVEVVTGTTIWFYESTQVDDFAVADQVEVLVDCQTGPACVEVKQATPASSAGLVKGSISGVSLSGSPTDESQAIFHDLVRSLAVDLAERLAGRRS